MNARHGLALMAAIAGLVLTASALAQGRKSEDVVKATATADKPDADGKQVVTITLDVDGKYHIYANPVGNEDLSSAQTKVSFIGKGKTEVVKVEYPAGDLIKDKTVGDYKTYKGKVTIKATVQRAKGDTGPLEVAIALQACTKTSCLLPGTVKVSVP